MLGRYEIVSADPLKIQRTGWAISQRSAIIGATAGMLVLTCAIVWFAGIGDADFFAMLVGLFAAIMAGIAGMLDGHRAIFLSGVFRIETLDEGGKRWLKIDRQRFAAEEIPRVQVGVRIVHDPNSSTTHTHHVVVVPLGRRGLELRADDEAHAISLATTIARAVGHEDVELEPGSQGSYGAEYWVLALVFVPLLCTVGIAPMLGLIYDLGAAATAGIGVAAALPLYALGRVMARWAAAKNLLKRLG